MKRFPENLQNKINTREQSHTKRHLVASNHLIDFSSNDYLGFSKNETLFQQTHQMLWDQNCKQNGATGSRLLSGNHKLYPQTETLIASFHKSEAALIFNSGYDANIGFFSAVPQKGDLILYDALIHASIRDGIAMSLAKAYKFEHNNLEALENLLIKHQESYANIYVVTETIFSMDGDGPDLKTMTKITAENGAYLVVDEAHALGVLGTRGEGLVSALGLQDMVFAQIVTFGKALGCHGAAIVGSTLLKEYLVNFSRSLIYTTALPPHAIANIYQAYTLLEASSKTIESLKENIAFFKGLSKDLMLNFIKSNSAIQSILILGNHRVKAIAAELQAQGFDVKPILSPTVKASEERLRFCLHSFNTTTEIESVLNALFQSLATTKA